MNPKPFVVLKNFTVPMAICQFLLHRVPLEQNAQTGRGTLVHREWKLGRLVQARD
jgi:hypothetical protein